MSGVYAPPEWSPSAAVKAMNGFSGGGAHFNADDQYFEFPGPIMDNAIAAGAGSFGVVILYLLFRFGHCCRLTKRCCCCCYQKKCCSKHTKTGKFFVALIFIACAGAMTASLHGMGKLKDGIDSVHNASVKSGDLLNKIKGIAGDLAYDAGVLSGGIDEFGCNWKGTFGKADGTQIGGSPCPSNGFCATKKQCEDSTGANDGCDWPAPTFNSASVRVDAMNNIASKVGGTGLISKFKEAGKTGADAIKNGAKGMEEALGKTGDQLKDQSDNMRDQAKDVVTLGIQLTIAFAYVVCFFAILTTICMSKGKGCLCGCKLSTLFGFFANLLGLVLLLLLAVLVTVEFVAAATASDICHGGGDEGVTPEENILSAFNKAGVDTEGPKNPLRYYMTCEGENPLDKEFQVAVNGFNEVDTQLVDFRKKALDEETSGLKPSNIMHCSVSPVRAYLSATNDTVDQMRNDVVQCENLNDIFLTLTREAFCGHFVDGLYALWVVQAAAGLLFVIGMIGFSMVMAGMKHPSDDTDPYSAAGIDKALEMELSRPQNAAGVQMVQPPSNPEQPDVYV